MVIGCLEWENVTSDSDVGVRSLSKKCSKLSQHVMPNKKTSGDNGCVIYYCQALIKSSKNLRSGSRYIEGSLALSSLFPGAVLDTMSATFYDLMSSNTDIVAGHSFRPSQPYSL